jgi:hypothetical protein
MAGFFCIFPEIVWVSDVVEWCRESRLALPANLPDGGTSVF